MSSDYDARRREKEAKRAKELSWDVGMVNPKVIGTIAGPEKHIPQQWRRYRMMNHGEFSNYSAKVAASGGYDVSGCTGRAPPGGIVEGKRSSETAKWSTAAQSYATFAVQKYNEKEGTDLEYVDIVRLNGQAVAGIMYYLTLRLLDKKENCEGLYYAKVWLHPILHHETECRLTLEEFKRAPEIERTEMPAKDVRKRTGGSLEVRRDPYATRSRKSHNEGATSETGRMMSPRSSSISDHTEGRDKSRRTKRPFDIFMEEFKRLPMVANKRYCDILRIGGTKWRSMSAGEKACYENRGDA